MWLIVGDLHLNDKHCDAYRFGIFKWLRSQQDKNPITATFLAGDMTDAKNRHSATLVNKVVDGLKQLKPPVYVVSGNHDYRDPTNPYFRFLNHIDGISFIFMPTVVVHDRSIGLIPHHKDEGQFNTAVQQMGPVDGYLVHQTFEGAIAESGVLLSGFSRSPIESMKAPLGVLAGDVHRPQRQGQVTYVGCPYHVRFGDNFNPRVLILDMHSRRRMDRHYSSPYKHSLTIRSAAEIERNTQLIAGDHVKVVVELSREQALDWQVIKAEIIEACLIKQVEIYGIKIDIEKPSNKLVKVTSSIEEDILEAFVKAEKLGKRLRTTGEQIRDNVQTQKGNPD